MPTITSIYDPQKIEKIKNFLSGLTLRNQPRPYEIFVDTFKVVPKTDDIEQFDLYEEYMDGDTRTITIKIYHTVGSPKNDQHIFRINSDAMSGQELAGIERMEQIVSEKLDAKDREYEAKRNVELLEEYRKKLEDADEYIDTLEERLDIAQSDRYKLKGFDLVEFGSIVLSRLAEKNADVLHGLGMGGLFRKDMPQEVPQLAPPQGSASFQKKKDMAGSDEKQLRHLATLQQLESIFNEQQMVGVIGILNHLMEHPGKIETVTALLT